MPQFRTTSFWKERGLLKCYVPYLAEMGVHLARRGREALVATNLQIAVQEARWPARLAAPFHSHQFTNHHQSKSPGQATWIYRNHRTLLVLLASPASQRLATGPSKTSNAENVDPRRPSFFPQFQGIYTILTFLDPTTSLSSSSTRFT